MPATASSSQSSRWPNPLPKSMPWRSCSCSNQAPPSPSQARPPETWSTVTAALAVSPGLRRVLAPTMSPSCARSVTAAQAARSVQPSKISWSGSPTMAWRWSQVQSESSPAASAARAASRSSGQVALWGHNSAPTRSGWRSRREVTGSVLQVVVGGDDLDPEGDPVLRPEAGDHALGLGGFVGVVGRAMPAMSAWAMA